METKGDNVSSPTLPSTVVISKMQLVYASVLSTYLTFEPSN